MKQKNIKLLIVTTIIVAIGALTINYAALSQVLKVKIDPTIHSAGTNWAIAFDNLSEPVISGNGTSGKVEVKDTAILLYDVVLKESGSSVSYQLEIRNKGDMKAKVAFLQKLNPIITGSGESKVQDEELVKNSYSYQVTYIDGSPILVGDQLKPNETVSFRITISYSEKAPLPQNEVKISGLGTIIHYEQA